MPDKSTHTSGATQAAIRITNYIAEHTTIKDGIITLKPEEFEKIIGIIEKETGVKDLLEAAEKALNIYGLFGSDTSTKDTFDNLRAAIAKCKGTE